MLKSNITVRIVRLPVVLLGLLVLEFIERPSYIVQLVDDAGRRLSEHLHIHFTDNVRSR